ncbi:Ig domain-containing protein [Actinoplanes sp. NPDC051343]|uniref:Ig domain-containing protein n=1 Tax=Actinoplanes sp. NPDC051343 TaxID=3363906 RepID=UPI0037BB74E2
MADPGAQAPTIGVAVSRTMSATGGTAPYTWSATGLAPGLTISASTGTISGKPTTAGIYTTVVSATDALKMVGKMTVVWNVAAAVVLGNLGSGTATTLTPYSVTESASGGSAPYTWSATGLPAGLSINDQGVISGTPDDITVETSYSYPHITVLDAQGRTATAMMSIILNRPVRITSASDSFIVEAVLPAGYVIEILEQTQGGKVVASCTAMPCNAHLTEKVDPGAHTYVARVVSTGGSDVRYTSLEKTVTWDTYQPSSVDSWMAGEVTHWITYPSNEATGSVVLTARSWDNITASPYYLEIRDNTGTTLASCATGYECSATITQSMQFNTFGIALATYTNYALKQGRVSRPVAGSNAVPQISFGAWNLSLTPLRLTNGDLRFRLRTDRYLAGPVGRFGPNYNSKIRGTMVLVDRTSGVARECSVSGTQSSDPLLPDSGTDRGEVRPMQWFCDVTVPAAEAVDGDQFQAAVMGPFKGCYPVYREYYDCRDEQATSAMLDTSPQNGTTPYLIVDPGLIQESDLVAQTLQQDGNLDKLGVRPSIDGKPSEIVRDTPAARTGAATAAVPPSYLVDSTRFAGGFKPDDRYQYATQSECDDRAEQTGTAAGWIKNRYSYCQELLFAGVTTHCRFLLLCNNTGYFLAFVTINGHAKVGAYQNGFNNNYDRWADFTVSVDPKVLIGTYADQAARLEVKMECEGGYDDPTLHPSGQACSPGDQPQVGKYTEGWVVDHDATLDLVSDAEQPSSAWGDQIARGEFHVDFDIDLPAPYTKKTYSSPNGGIRFDSAYYLNVANADLLGSVFDRATPGFAFSVSDPTVRGAAQHIQYAQTFPQNTYPTLADKKLPGASAADPLHRLAQAKGPAQAERYAENDRIGRINYCNTKEQQLLKQQAMEADPANTYQCDEYPLRSTYEGAGRSSYDPAVPVGPTRSSGSSTRRTWRPATDSADGMTRTACLTETRSSYRSTPKYALRGPCTDAGASEPHDHRPAQNWASSKPSGSARHASRTR